VAVRNMASVLEITHTVSGEASGFGGFEAIMGVPATPGRGPGGRPTIDRLSV
jgi:hypothetical protein